MAKQTVADLKRCIRGCRDDALCIEACRTKFVQDGGTAGTADSGKVFTDPDGGKVFVTDSGKVFDITA
jgi:hypothetical protein